jgi:adenylate cyclase
LHHAVKRKLTTIFCADVVGYSRLMGVDEAGTLRRLKECRELVAAFIDRHRGRVVSWSGDAVLADFASVVEAVQCAIEIQRELKARNDGKPEAERMEFRIGINLGDVMIEDHDIFGEGVNIAARLQSLAAPGGILISGSVHDQVRNKLAVGFNFMGHQQVKNIADQVPVFFVAHDGAPLTSISTAPAAALTHNKTTANKRAPTRIYATLVSRAGAGLVDIIAAGSLAVAVGVGLVAAFGDVVELNDLVIPLAIEKTIETETPSIEIIAGGTVTRTTQRSIVERNFFGFATQTVRRTSRELSVGQNTSVARPQDAAELRAIKGGEWQEDVLIDPRSRQTLERPSLWFVAITTYFLMLALCEGLLFGGSSPGKLLFGLRVAGAQGEAMTIWRALARNLAKVLSVVTALIGFFMVLWTKRHQALHDMVADCVVVTRGSRV